MPRLKLVVLNCTSNRLSILAESDLSRHFVSLSLHYGSFLWWLFSHFFSNDSPGKGNNACKHLRGIIMKTKPIHFRGAPCLWKMHHSVSLWHHTKAVCFLSDCRTWATFPSCSDGNCLVSIHQRSFVSWTHYYCFSFSWSTSVKH